MPLIHICQRRSKELLCTFIIFFVVVLASKMFGSVDQQVDVIGVNKDSGTKAFVQPQLIHRHPALKEHGSVDQQVDVINVINVTTDSSMKACVHPQLELWHPALKGYFNDHPPLQCSEEENWVYVDNGTFKISPTAIKKHGDIECAYIPINRGNDDFTLLVSDPIKAMKDGTPLDSDFFEVDCVAADNKTYKNVHSGIAYNARLHARSFRSKMPKDALGLDVLMFGFDSTSRMTWMRNLPKTYDYFVNVLGGTVMEGYNIVGDGTPQALLPILTGKPEWELPEARRGKPGAQHVDGHPWIWKDFHQAGYVTQWGEDESGAGTFTYRMLGFQTPPVDHYMRTFYLKAEKQYRKHKPYCLGSVPRHLNMMNWVRDFYHMYKDKPKFSFLFHTEFTHQGHSKVRVVDEDFKNFLKQLHEGGFLNKTLLILMADHGARFQTIRQTVQGKYEERMPYFSLRFPPWFEKKHPTAIHNLKNNAKKLTTPFDIHATFKHLLTYNGTKEEKITQRGMSLLNIIPPERTCAHADIEAHWCACLNWENISSTDKSVKGAAIAVLEKINAITEPERKLCEPLQLYKIISAYRYVPNNKLVMFKKSKDRDGRIPDLSDNVGLTEVFLQVTMETLPGGGMYEASMKVNLKTSQYDVSDNQISRINKYGSQPHCVASRLPHMRPYCYCKQQLSS